MSGRTLTPRTAEVFAPLWERDARFKGAWGGRGSGKSNDAAQRALIKMLTVPGWRIVCLREVQNSIKDSVHQLMCDWIQRLGIGGEFEVLRDEIKGPNGSLAIFRGMKDQNAESIKSLAGFHCAWFEEAQVMSQRSLDLLRPTIREAGSELWFTWNPGKKTDPIDLFLRAKPPADAIVVRANYSDNPWFPAELELERQIDEAGDPDRYAHIWEGAYEAASDTQFIPAGLVSAAQTAKVEVYPHDELILGVDVARYGDDETIIAVRRGRDAYTEAWLAYKGLDTMEVAARVADQIMRLRPDGVFVDDGGVGAGVVDRLRQMGHEITAVNFGRKPDGLTKAKTANKRAEMWQRMKEWLQQGGVGIPDDPALEGQLTAVEYKHDVNNAILLEKKDDMRRRGLPSPDRADALALTFAYPVVGRGYAVDDTWDNDHGDAGRSEAVGY